MIGLSFKTGTDDLRESPLVLLAEHFIGKGLRLPVYDPEVHLSNLLGANRRFIEQHMPHIGSLIRGDIELVVAGIRPAGRGPQRSRNPGYSSRVASLRRLVAVIDLTGVGAIADVRGKHVGLCW